MNKIVFVEAVKIWNRAGLSIEERMANLNNAGWTFTELMLENIKRQDAYYDNLQKEELS